MASIENTEGKPERLYFKFFLSFYKAINNLPDNAQLALYRAIAAYSLDFQEPDFSQMENAAFIQAIWEGFRPILRDGVQHFLNGANGGAPEGNQNARKQPKNNQETTEKQAPYKEKGKRIMEKGNNMDNQETLVFPFHSPKFLETWKELCSQPKWRKKTPSALQKSLDKLAGFPEAFAVELIETAIANDTQGVVYPSTPEAYKKWQKDIQGGTDSKATSGHQRPRNPRIDIDRNTPEDTSTI